MAKTIMTVDDAATMRKLIAFTLKGAGHSVIEAEDGPTAIRLLGANAVDLIISDVNMPHMTGVELTRRVRQMPAYKTTPILIVTTESEAGIKSQAKTAGATGWIVKPFNPQQLVDVVNKVFKT